MSLLLTRRVALVAAKSKFHLNASQVLMRGMADFPIPPDTKPMVIADKNARREANQLAHGVNPWTRVQDPKGSGQYYWQANPYSTLTLTELK